MKSYKDEGVIIKRRNHGEASKIITIFTQNHGKVTLLARGIRKITSRRAGSLELFNLVKISVVEGRGDLGTLTEVQPLNTFSSWKSKLGRVTIAYQLAETLDKLTPDHEPHFHLLNLLVTFLSQISTLKDNWREVVDGWLLEIVRELGFWPHDQPYNGEVSSLVEEISQKNLNSPKLFSRLK